MAKKSSKTAHVLNLISDHTPAQDPAPDPAASPAPETEASAAEAAPVQREAPPKPTVPIVEMAVENDHALSEKIHSALLSEMESELADLPAQHKTESPAPVSPVRQEAPGQPAPPPTQHTVPDEAPAQQEANTAADNASAQLPEKETIAVHTQIEESIDSGQATPPQTDTAPQAKQEEASPSPPQKQTFANDNALTYNNVMQALVEEKADEYIKRLGVCTCPRCRADVIALALTSLPAKYVVMHHDAMIPMLTLYFNQYNVEISAQLARACMQVLQNPRH